MLIRIDGKAFHTFTKGFKRPFDEILIEAMQETTKYLCKHIQGCVLGYTQSDEITLILIDYKKRESCGWFNYEVQKICSVAASMATMAFNKAFSEIYHKRLFEDLTEDPYYETIFNKVGEAMFDARCFNLPKEEVVNNLYLRQLDASRNSIQMVGRANFSHGELQNKSCNEIQDMLFTQKGINWNNLPTYQKRGSCCIKEYYQSEEVDIKDGGCMRSRWIIDKEIPIFKGEGRDYIEKLINFKENENEIL